MELRRHLAAKAFAAVASYDHAIATYFAGAGIQKGDKPRTELPTELKVHVTRTSALRYGENPHQLAGVYRDTAKPVGLASARPLQGKELSYNNLLDLDAALALVREFAGKGALAIIKHTNPCGAAADPAVGAADLFRRALATDQRSAFGGIIATDRTIDLDAAEAMTQIFLECIVAPHFTPEAAAHFSTKKNVRLLQLPELADQGTKPPVKAPLKVRSIDGGFLMQTEDLGAADRCAWKVVTKVQPTEADWESLMFAARVAKHVKSNAIVLARGGQTIGVGAGQMSRIDSARIAAEKAREMSGDAHGSVMASDAFFPFGDTVLLAAEIGVRAIVQPGGSLRDEDSIEAANRAGIAMVFTEQRHFRH